MKRSIVALFAFLILTSQPVVCAAVVDSPTSDTAGAAVKSVPSQSGQEPLFQDVAADAFYSQAVIWGVERGITSGTGDGLFSPNAVCTNAQAITLLWRACGAPEPAARPPFSDVSSDAYYSKAAAWAYETGLVSGSIFGGDWPCTQGTAVTWLWKLAGEPAPQTDAEAETPWNLILVNPWNFLPKDFTVSLTQVGNGHSVDARCADALLQMLQDCRSDGYAPVIRSSYRTQATQQSLFSNRVAERMARGMSRAKAMADTARSTAVPGTSEHQTGLAVDLVDSSHRVLNNSQASTPTQKWLMAHSWEYGFILRYSSEKTGITGIIYEPWHYRYVGKTAAEEIYRQEICLEEYLPQLQERQQAERWAAEQGVTAGTLTAFDSDADCTRAQLIYFLHQRLASAE